MFVKICGITNEQDALLAVALGADALGFVFAPSPRQVAAQRVREIVRRLPQDILTIGVFRDEHPQRVIETMREAGLVGVQLHGHESARTVAEVMVDIKWVIKSVVAGSVEARHADDFPTGIVIIDSATPGTGTGYDFDLVNEIPETMRVILSGGLTPENVVQAVRTVVPWGVDVSSGVEKSPGYKDPIKMKHFITNARSVQTDELLEERSENSSKNPEPYNWQDEAR